MDDISKLAKTYLKSIPTKKEFMDLLDILIITDLERNVLIKFYLEHKGWDLVAHDLGYSPQHVKGVHRDALIKVCNYIRTKSL